MWFKKKKQEQSKPAQKQAEVKLEEKQPTNSVVAKGASTKKSTAAKKPDTAKASNKQAPAKEKVVKTGKATKTENAKVVAADKKAAPAAKTGKNSSAKTSTSATKASKQAKVEKTTEVDKTSSSASEEKTRKALYRVIYNKESRVWEIKKDGAKRVIATFATKEEATSRVKALAESQDLNFVVHKKDGKFQRK